MFACDRVFQKEKRVKQSWEHSRQEFHGSISSLFGWLTVHPVSIVHDIEFVWRNEEREQRGNRLGVKATFESTAGEAYVTASMKCYRHTTLSHINLLLDGETVTLVTFQHCHGTHQLILASNHQVEGLSHTQISFCFHSLKAIVLFHLLEFIGVSPLWLHRCYRRQIKPETIFSQLSFLDHPKAQRCSRLDSQECPWILSTILRKDKLICTDLKQFQTEAYRIRHFFIGGAEKSLPLCEGRGRGSYFTLHRFHCFSTRSFSSSASSIHIHCNSFSTQYLHQTHHWRCNITVWGVFYNSQYV